MKEEYFEINFLLMQWGAWRRGAINKVTISAKRLQEIESAVRKLQSDMYIDIIYLSYEKLKSRTYIANKLYCHEGTVTRNKNRLIMSIAELLKE